MWFKCRGPRFGAGVVVWFVVRRFPTLPHPVECSTIGAGRLSFRVRDGAGRFPAAMTAATFSGCVLFAGGWLVVFCIAVASIWTQNLCRVCVCGVCLCCCFRPISTSKLHTLPCFHTLPINVLVSNDSLVWLNHKGSLIFRRVSRLDAFSAYLFRT